MDVLKKFDIIEKIDELILIMDLSKTKLISIKDIIIALRNKEEATKELWDEISNKFYDMLIYTLESALNLKKSEIRKKKDKEALEKTLMELSKGEKAKIIPLPKP